MRAQQRIWLGGGGGVVCKTGTQPGTAGYQGSCFLFNNVLFIFVGPECLWRAAVIRRTERIKQRDALRGCALRLVWSNCRSWSKGMIRGVGGMLRWKSCINVYFPSWLSTFIHLQLFSSLLSLVLSCPASLSFPFAPRACQILGESEVLVRLC